MLTDGSADQPMVYDDVVWQYFGVEIKRSRRREKSSGNMVKKKVRPRRKLSVSATTGWTFTNTHDHGDRMRLSQLQHGKMILYLHDLYLGEMCCKTTMHCLLQYT